MTPKKSNTHSNVIEVNSILFETLMPEKTIRLPKYDEEVTIQFGVQITNRTSIPYRFETQQFSPEILDPRGHEKYRSSGRNATRWTTDLDVPILQSDEGLEFLMNGTFSWYGKDYTQLSGDFNYGGVWFFYDFQPGKHQVRLNYTEQSAKRKGFFFHGKSEFNDFWVGEVATPWVQLRLR